eukprot:TRINITY_DN16410_c0_g1_i2.p1 TRINITY_DN16410_c0_g1~~TRINITY_DN16410_c0_g1_i2.p1  ORF type:complete len:707 (+),score=180.48 TRINITY_DN16410_c0_g1_i2:26-2146(+)
MASLDEPSAQEAGGDLRRDLWDKVAADIRRGRLAEHYDREAAESLETPMAQGLPSRGEDPAYLLSSVLEDAAAVAHFEHLEPQGLGQDHPRRHKAAVMQGEDSFQTETTALMTSVQEESFQTDGTGHAVLGGCEDDSSFALDGSATPTAHQSPSQEDSVGEPASSEFERKHLEPQDDFALLLERPSWEQSLSSNSPSSITREHSRWARELECLDQRQADLMMVQWKMIRSQTGALAQQLVQVQKDLDVLRKEHRQTISTLEQQARESQDFQQRMAASLQKTAEQSHTGMAKTRANMDAEVRQRAAQDAEIMQRLGKLEAEVAAYPKLGGEISELQTGMARCLKQLPKLKDQMRQHVDCWKSEQAVVMEHNAKLHDSMKKAVRTLMKAHENHESEMQQTFSILRQKYDQQLDCLEESFHDFSAARMDEQLLGRVSGLETAVEGLSRDLKDQMQGCEARLRDRVASHKELEQSVSLLTSSLNKEITSRHCMVDVFERMLQSESSKLSHVVEEAAASTRLECSELRRVLTDQVMDHLAKETSDRQDHARKVARELEDLGHTLDKRLAAADAAWAGPDVKAQLQRLEAGTAANIQQLRSELRGALDQERWQRELADTGLSEQVDVMEDFHKLMREFYSSKGRVVRTSALLRSQDSEIGMGRLADMLGSPRESRAEMFSLTPNKCKDHLNVSVGSHGGDLLRSSQESHGFG